MNIQSFVLYTDVRPILDLVPPEDGLPLLKAIFDYAAGEEVEPFQNFVTAKVWEMIRQKLEAGREKAMKRSETNRQNIRARWDKEKDTTVYDSVQKNTTVNDSIQSNTNGVHIQNSTVQYCDSTELSQLHVQDSNITDTEKAEPVLDPAGGRPAGASAAEAAPQPAPETDLFTIDQIKNCIRKNKIDLSDDGAAAFLEEMHGSGWTLYGKPVEKRFITRTLREWAKRHGEYAAADPEEEARAAAEKARRAKEAARRVREREEAKAREQAEAEERKRREREAEARRKQEEAERPERFADLLSVAKKHSRPDKVPEDLQKLMERDEIPEYALMAFNGVKDFFPADKPISECDSDYITLYCIKEWDTIRETIRKYAEVTGIEF